MIEKKAYHELQKLYGQTSSWTIWAPPQNGKWNSKDSVSDMSLFENEDSLCGILNSDYIFVGLNPANHDAGAHEAQNWENFHSSDTKRSQDYKLRYALWDTPYWGSFITDAYPKIQETDSAKAIKKVTSVATQESIRDILYAREILGNKATIIAVGSKSYNILKKEPLLSTIPIIKITHYSHRINIENYRKNVIIQLSSVPEIL